MFGKLVEQQKLKQLIEMLLLEQKEALVLQTVRADNTELLVESVKGLHKKLDDMQDLIHKQIVIHREELTMLDEEIRQIRTNQLAMNKDIIQIQEVMRDMNDTTTSRDHVLYQELLKTNNELNSVLDYAEFDTTMQEFLEHLSELAEKIAGLSTSIQPTLAVQPNYLTTTATWPIGTSVTTGTNTVPTVYQFPGMSAERVQELKEKIDQTIADGGYPQVIEEKPKKKRSPRKHTLTGDAETVKRMQDQLDQFTADTEHNASQGQD